MGWRALWRQGADEGRHFDDDLPIVVREAGEGAEDDDVAAEFFVNLPDEGGFGGFIGLDFSAREFPFQRQVFVRGALRDQDAAGGVFQDGADNRNGWGLRHGMKGGRASHEERFGPLCHQSSAFITLGTQAAG